MMFKKLLFLTSFVLVLSLVSSNVVFGAITIERTIVGSNNDTEHKIDAGVGGADRGSSDLEMPYEGDGATGDKQIIGLRFLDIPFEKGEQVSNAYIQFTGDSEKLSGDTVNLIINGLLQLNPVEFGDGEQFYDDRDPKTTAEVKWSNIPDWAASQATEASKTPNIASIINEILNQDGWTNGDALIICIRDDETNPSTDIRSALANGYARLIFETSVSYASEPDPADGALLEDTWVTLMWDPGKSAVSNDVYLSENSADVEAGAESAFQGNQATAMFIAGFPGYPYPDGLALGETYYWRVDSVEADGTKIAGSVWSFTVPSKKAYLPIPANRGKYVDTDVELSWTPGFGSKLHTVYFGDNYDDVNNATGGLPQAAGTYTPGTLEMDKTYYWRVDEFDAINTYKGDVWSFSTLPIIEISDPNLIGYWKFDEASGDIALDFSGYGNDGELGGTPVRVEGILGGALDLTGDDYVVIDSVVDDITNKNITLSAWIRTTQAGEGNVIASNTGSSHVLQFGIDNGNIWVDDGPGNDFPPAVNDDQWHMITLVQKGTNISLYTDGVQVGSVVTSIDITSEARWSIGQEWDSAPSDFYIGMVDEVRFYNSALTAEQVQELMRGDPLAAWNPKPNNKSTVDIKEASKPISWSAGDEAAEHDVYFGTDKNAVSNTDASDTTGVYLGRQGGTSLTLPAGSVEWGGGPYYWRVDENNNDGSITTGATWNFSVADYLIVDDMESYNNINEEEPGSNRIYLAWADGYGDPSNGSTVGHLNPPFAEQSIVHSGMQAMPLFYDNGVGISEATLTLVDQKNWTEEGVGVLVIWFRGEAANAVVPLYVAVNGNAVVTHSNLTATQIDTWTEWTIDLQLFADQGVNLSNVNTISLGLGNKSNPTAGGTGTMYFDDIRLYRPAP